MLMGKTGVLEAESGTLGKPLGEASRAANGVEERGPEKFLGCLRIRTMDCASFLDLPCTRVFEYDSL